MVSKRMHECNQSAINCHGVLTLLSKKSVAVAELPDRRQRGVLLQHVGDVLCALSSQIILIEAAKANHS